MTAAPIALSFFDPARSLYGTARAGATLLFEGSAPAVLAEGPEVEARGDAIRAELEGHLTLEAEPISVTIDLGGVDVRVCRVRGEVGGTRVDCLGTVSETRTAPAWEELDALRSISALLDERNALLALGRRPRGALGHGEERVAAALLREGELIAVEDARISTVYDGAGRQRSAGLELWLPGEELPRRGSGNALAGSTLELEEVTVHAAVFDWRLDGREGIGAYELMARPAPRRAA